MTVRAIVNGEMATSGSKIFLANNEGVAQLIETRLKWHYGEAFLDSNNGTPWFQSILGKARGYERESVLKSVILGTTGVSKLLAFSITQTDKALNVTGVVSTAYSDSQTTFNVSI